MRQSPYLTSIHQIRIKKLLIAKNPGNGSTQLKKKSNHETWEKWNVGTSRAPEDQDIKNKWVFKMKHDKNDKPTRYKAKLVPKGYSQI